MMDLNDIFNIVISKDKMEAKLTQLAKVDGEVQFSDLLQFIKNHGIKYGIKEDVLQSIIDEKVELPVIIAEGKKPKDGQDAYLKPLITIDDDVLNHSSDEKKVDFKKVKEIPSVKTGGAVGIKVEKKNAENGINIFDEEVKAKPARDFKLRAGKNTRVDDDGQQIISKIDGQVSNETKVIHVFPVYEINGDMDMSTGDIDFVGNVNIRGNVPSGFTIKTEGDVRIRGSVESAIIDAGGSVYVHQGVVGQGKGEIRARGDFHTSFINQGNVKVEGDVHVSQSILHSNVDAQGYVFCTKRNGNIVGGNVSAGKGIEVNEVGNTMNTPTSLYLGLSKHIVENEKKFKEELNETQLELDKLELLLSKIIEKEENGLISPQERILKLRIRNSIESMKALIENHKDKLLDLHDIFENQEIAKINIHKNIHPNCNLFFGKYRRKIVSKHQYVSFRLDKKEITFEPL